ncbi:MAG: Gfo/Idh/MocA family oxidoreductase [Chlorobium phaeovibrioides]|nr:Gfo/Idh/MocA family oxidoreductase [Chlorobium phaeovibrioides]
METFLMKSLEAEHSVLNVLIVGCGNIAGGFDEGRSADSFPYTHAGAYARDGRFTITACVEPDDHRRGKFMEVWGVPLGFRSIDELQLSGERFDLISICSPTTFHADDLAAAVSLKPKLIFSEKPVTTTVEQTERMVDMCRTEKIPLAINYTRRWDSDITKLQLEIHTAQWGTLRSVTGLYNKGILNNGSHMIDLLHLLIGPMRVVAVGNSVYDYCAEDPSIPVWLEGVGGLAIQLACAHADDYAVFELQLIFSKGILSMEDGGLFWRERCAVNSALFRGYRKLEHEVRRQGEYAHAMLNAVDNIYRAINKNEPLVSTGETALAAQRICEEVKQLALS